MVKSDAGHAEHVVGETSFCCVLWIAPGGGEAVAAGIALHAAAEVLRGDGAFAATAFAGYAEFLLVAGSMEQMLGRDALQFDVFGLNYGHQFFGHGHDAGDAVGEAADGVLEDVADEAAVAEVLVAMVEEPAKAEQQFALGSAGDAVVILVAEDLENAAELVGR